MKKILRELSIYVGLFSGSITVNDYIYKKRSLKEIKDSYELLQSQKDQEISFIEIQTKIDLSKIIKINTDSGFEFNQSTEFLSKAEIEKNLYGNIRNYQYYLDKDKAAQQRITDIQSDIEKFDVNKFNMENGYENFKEYLLTLSVDQTFALLHIIFFITMLFLVYNIIIIYYSDLIIKYFSLDSKYPRLFRVIDLRRKFQSYYMAWNLIVLILILLLLLILNLLVFLNII
jgi:hypothetical protein